MKRLIIAIFMLATLLGCDRFRQKPIWIFVDGDPSPDKVVYWVLLQKFREDKVLRSESSIYTACSKIQLKNFSRQSKMTVSS